MNMLYIFSLKIFKCWNIQKKKVAGNVAGFALHRKTKSRIYIFHFSLCQSTTTQPVDCTTPNLWPVSIALVRDFGTKLK